MKISLVMRLRSEIHFCGSSSNVPRLASFLYMLQNFHVLLIFGRVQNPLHLPHKTRLQRPKVARTCGGLYILTSKCASRHNGVHFFDISTSNSGPSMLCFVNFDLEMCFAPQRRALFQHLNFQKVIRTRQFLTLLSSKCVLRRFGFALFRHHNFKKCSEHGVFCTF